MITRSKVAKILVGSSIPTTKVFSLQGSSEHWMETSDAILPPSRSTHQIPSECKGKSLALSMTSIKTFGKSMSTAPNMNC